MTSFEFARPEFLYLLLLLPLWWLVVWPWANGGVLYTSGEFPGGLVGSWRSGALMILGLPRLLRLSAMASLVGALAHPQLIEVVQETELRGKSLAIAVDISPKKLELAKNFGAWKTVDASQVQDVGKEVRKLTGGGADIATGYVPPPGK